MYFHLIGIKEKGETKYELDFLLSGGDEEIVREFLSHRGVVVVSFDIFKEDPTTFGNISMSIPFKNNEIQIIMQGDDLSERLYFVSFLGLTPAFANLIKNPISELEMKQLLEATFNKVKLLNEEIKRQKEEEVLMEQKKYEEKGIKDGLRIINHNIDYIEQIIKAGKGIILGTEITKLEDCLNEMKKIRLGTNFNKMANIILEAHELIKKVEPEILQAYDSKKFLINKNTSVTNIDVINENRSFDRISETATIMPKMLDYKDNIRGIIGYPTIFLQLLKRDISYTFQQTSFSDFFRILMNLCEYFVSTGIVVIVVLWLLSPLIGIQNFSLYLLPACGWLGLLLYLFNALNLKKPPILILVFAILVVVYWRGLLLLLSTFAI